MATALKIGLFGGPCDGQTITVGYPPPPLLAVPIPRHATAAAAPLPETAPYQLCQVGFADGTAGLVYSPPGLLNRMLA
jgi:hypothetical protein